MSLEIFMRHKFNLMPIPPPKGDYDGKTPYKGVTWRQFVANPMPYKSLLELFRQNPNDNLAILTGRASRLLVVDIDRHGASDEVFNRAVNNVLSLYKSPPPRVITGGGGVHLYTAYMAVKNTIGLKYTTLFPDDVDNPVLIDIKSDGGYVIAPPSLHKSGKHYIFHPASPLDDDSFPLPPLPIPLLNLVAEAQAPKTSENWQSLMSQVTDGSRHSSSTQVIGLFLKHFSPQYWEGIDWPSIQDWNKRAVKPPMTEKELRGVFESLANKEFEKYKV